LSDLRSDYLSAARVTQQRVNTQLPDVCFVLVIHHRLVRLAKLSVRLITKNNEPFNKRNTLRILHTAVLAMKMIPLMILGIVIVLTGNKLKQTDSMREMSNSFPVHRGGTDTRRLTTGILSEKCVVRRFHRCANVIECTYTNLDSTV
jgi:hypothetical protein